MRAVVAAVALHDRVGERRVARIDAAVDQADAQRRTDYTRGQRERRSRCGRARRPHAAAAQVDMMEVVHPRRVDRACPRNRVLEFEAGRRLQHDQRIAQPFQRVLAQGLEAGSEQGRACRRARRLRQHLGAHDQLALRVAVEFAAMRPQAPGRFLQARRGQVDRRQGGVDQRLHALEHRRTRDRRQRRAQRGQAQLRVGRRGRQERDRERKESASSGAHVHIT